MGDLVNTIRRAAQEGVPITSAQTLALCDEAERWKRQASLWADNIAALTKERDVLISAIRAWTEAIEKQDVAEIERAEHGLIAAAARL